MKAKRQAKILEIVSTRDVETQEQLLEFLQNAGIYSTQATISRDIKELRIAKELTKYGIYRYAVTPKETAVGYFSKLNTIFKESVTDFDFAQNLVVVRTIPGLASAAASSVDSMGLGYVLGTVAGDDTVLIVMRNSEAAAAFCADLKDLLK